MEWQAMGVLVAIIGLILTIVTNAIVLTWHLSRFSGKVDAWTDMFSRFEKGLEKYMVKTDLQLDTLWKRHDDIKERVVILESKS